jgi:hypothetical protein
VCAVGVQELEVEISVQRFDCATLGPRQTRTRKHNAIDVRLAFHWPLALLPSGTPLRKVSWIVSPCYGGGQDQAL